MTEEEAKEKAGGKVLELRPKTPPRPGARFGTLINIPYISKIVGVEDVTESPNATGTQVPNADTK